MNLLAPHFGTTVTHESGTRDRMFTNWKLIPAPEAPGQYYAMGQTLTEHGQALSHCRLTTTSLIVRREGRTLITTSGSRYTLLEPLEKADSETYLLVPE